MPLESRAWTPKAVVLCHEVVRKGLPVSPTLAAHPAHALARWPAIEQAVKAYTVVLLVDDERSTG